MADTKTGEEDIRKIQRTGQEGASYMVTLPKQLIKDLGWQERQKVVVTKEGNKLVIKDWEE